MTQRYFVWTAWIAAAAATLLLALPLAARAAATPADGLPKVSLTDLKGKPALVAFIHTQCEGPCELITAEMKSVARNLGPSFKSEVTMISITTEPNEDGSHELLAYAKKHGVNADGWVFLTGAPAEIRGLLSLYGVAAEDDKSDHVLEIFLLSADGAGVRRYSGVAAHPQAIASDIRKTASLH